MDFRKCKLDALIHLSEIVDHRKQKNDRCPICRAKLAKDNPTIPNITLDNVIEKYIQILAKSGAKEWIKGGAKFKEWTLRKEYV